MTCGADSRRLQPRKACQFACIGILPVLEIPAYFREAVYQELLGTALSYRGIVLSRPAAFASNKALSARSIMIIASLSSK